MKFRYTISFTTEIELNEDTMVTYGYEPGMSAEDFADQLNEGMFDDYELTPNLFHARELDGPVGYPNDVYECSSTEWEALDG